MQFPDLPLTSERITNRKAYLANKSRCDEEADVKIKALTNSVIGQDADITTHLAFAIMALAKIVDPTLVQNALLPDVTVARAMISQYSQAMEQVLLVRSERDAAIANFVLPHPDVGL